MINIRDSAENPLNGNKWWQTAENPFQALATCREIINAIDSGNVETYESSLPIHQDGSCNGLQHYAALGKDTAGAKAVNLANADLPQAVLLFPVVLASKAIAPKAAFSVPVVLSFKASSCLVPAYS